MFRSRSSVLSVLIVIAFATASLAPLAALFPLVGTASAATGDLAGTVRFDHDCTSGIGTGITFDGTNLWYSCYANSTDLYRADPTTGNVTGSWSVASGLGSIAYDAARNVIWAGPGGGSFSGWVIEIPLDASKNVSGSYSLGFAVPDAAAAGCGNLDDGIAIDGVSNVLYVSYDCSLKVFTYNATSGASLGSFPWGGASCYNSGVAIGGNLLYQGSDGCSHVWVVDKTTLSGQFNFSTVVTGDPNFRDEGLSCDTRTFASQGVSVMWSKEAYSPMRAAAFAIPSGTCGIGGLPACTPLIGASIVDPTVGFDYDEGRKIPQSPPQPLPTMFGVNTLLASTTDANETAEVDFYVDATRVGSTTSSPFALSWDAGSVPVGTHTLTVQARDTAGCIASATQPFLTEAFTIESGARALFATTLQPAQPTLQSEGASYPARSSSVLRDEHDATLGLDAQLLRDTANQTATTSRSTSEVANVSILGGLVKASFLRGAASASFDPAAFSFDADASGSAVAGLVVDGQPVTVDRPNTRVDVPGVGYLVADAQDVTMLANHAEVIVAALHLYVDERGLRGEVILGQAVAGTNVGGEPYVGLAHAVDAEDDAGTGGDVGGDYATGLVVPVGLVGDVGWAAFGGRVGGADAADVYKFQVAQGEKLDVLVQPSVQAIVTTHALPDPPAVGGASLDSLATPQIDLQLLDPATHGVVLESLAPLSLPQRLELNVNETGLWAIRLSSGQVANYTVSIAVSPMVLTPEAATGRACGDPGSPVLSRPATNSMSGTDSTQEYQLHASIGDNVAVGLFMPDPDGQNFDLTLYDDACRVLWTSAFGHSLLWPGDQPKGEPDAVVALPARYTGTYYVEVSRVVGAGNYLLVPYVGTVIPTLPMDDAFTGHDASNDCSAPTPLPLPDGAFEGRLDDGDPLDCYSFPIAAGDAMSVTLLPSPANTVSMTVTGGGGSVAQEDVLGHGSVVLRNASPSAETILVAIRPLVGGGNYAFTVLHAGAT